ncbi:MAG: ABC transporter ATP-binding protein [Arcobacter sp.]|nr:MAG: ABC transporter ATP-binding protein [Arcobacter sp.]
MSKNSLEIRNLSVKVGDNTILDDISLSIEEGEHHILFGPNGSGKSSLLSTIMGLPPYEIISGKIIYNGEDIQTLGIDERAKKGIGMTFQRPPSLEGVTLKDLSSVLESETTYNIESSNLDLKNFEQRQINMGFSGGEIKRWEVLKLFLQDPKVLLFDEPESGVDLQHIAAVGKSIERLLDSPKNGIKRSALIITHTGFILDYIKADYAHMMIDGKIEFSGKPAKLLKRIKENGYNVSKELRK